MYICIYTYTVRVHLGTLGRPFAPYIFPDSALEGRVCKTSDFGLGEGWGVAACSSPVVPDAWPRNTSRCRQPLGRVSVLAYLPRTLLEFLKSAMPTCYGVRTDVSSRCFLYKWLLSRSYTMSILKLFDSFSGKIMRGTS